MITSIQLHENTKQELENLKEDNGESYEDVIIKLIDTLDKQKREEETLLIEGYTTMADESRTITKSFTTADEELPWDW